MFSRPPRVPRAAHCTASVSTRTGTHIFLIGEATTSEEHAQPRQALFDMWDSLNREDISILERLQHGRRSPAFDGGRLSPHWEGPTHDFGRRIVGKILAD